jgi:hypothetical protein
MRRIICILFHYKLSKHSMKENLMATKTCLLVASCLLILVSTIVSAQVPDGYKAPRVPSFFGLEGDVPDDGPLGGYNPECMDLFFATSQAECPFPGAMSRGFGSLMPSSPLRQTPGIVALGIFPGENSVNLPVPPLAETIWDVLGLPTTPCTNEFGMCDDMRGSGFEPLEKVKPPKDASGEVKALKDLLEPLKRLLFPKNPPPGKRSECKGVAAAVNECAEWGSAAGWTVLLGDPKGIVSGNVVFQRCVKDVKKKYPGCTLENDPDYPD